MRNIFIMSICIVLFLSIRLMAEEENRLGVRVGTDSVVSLENAIYFIEAGFQRGEMVAALKVISDDYNDGNILMTREMVRSKINTIIRKKDQAISESNVKGGIYFNILGVEFKNKKALVNLKISIYSPTDSGAKLKEIYSNLEFKRSGGGWILTSSDGFLKELLSAYHKPAESVDPEKKAEKKLKSPEVR